MSSIRVVIVGAGKMGRAHGLAFSSLQGCEIVGVASRSGESARALANELGVTRWGSDWRELARSSGAHACVVAVSHERNEELTRACLEEGLHVLSEKPVALTVSSIEELAAKAREKGLIALAAVNRRFYPSISRAIDTIHLLGGVEGVSITAPDSAESRRVNGSQSDFVCDHWIRMNTIHAIDLLRIVAGEPIRTKGFRSQHARRDHVSITAAFEYERGVLGTFAMHGGVSSDWEMRIFGDGYEIQAKPLEQSVIRFGKQKEKVLFAGADGTIKMGLREQAAAFVDSVIAGKVVGFPCSDLSDHARTMRLVEELEQLTAPA